MIPPIRLGTKNTVLKILEPLIPRVRTYATAKAIRLIRTIETITNKTVNQNEWINASFWNAFTE